MITLEDDDDPSNLTTIVVPFDDAQNDENSRDSSTNNAPETSIRAPKRRSTNCSTSQLTEKLRQVTILGM